MSILKKGVVRKLSRLYNANQPCGEKRNCSTAINRNLMKGVREPSQIIVGRQPKIVEASKAFDGLLQSNHKVFISAGATTPTPLLKSMVDYAKANNLKDIKTGHMHLEGKLPFEDPSCFGIIRTMSFFMGKNVRGLVSSGQGDSIPVFLSEIPSLIYNKIFDPDLAVITVSPPDKHGFCTLGTSVDCVRAGVVCAKKIIALINKKMPRTFGNTCVHLSQIDVAVETDTPLPENKPGKIDEASAKIGKLIAEQLVDNGSTLQMGIGNIPNAALAAMNNHKDLGIHTEMFTDGLLPLIKSGVITNRAKPTHTGRTITSFAVGSKQLFDFVDDNPSIEFLRVEYTNDTMIIERQHRMVAINSCIEVDLTGQVVSDSIGTRMYSGFGGQVDFMRGAAHALDGRGKAIMAFVSQSKGRSKIVPIIQPGAGVTTTRGHVRYVVTENGIANLAGKSLRQRAYELIKLADPAHREKLEKAAFERLKVKPSP